MTPAQFYIVLREHPKPCAYTGATLHATETGVCPTRRHVQAVIEGQGVDTSEELKAFRVLWINTATGRCEDATRAVFGALALDAWEACDHRAEYMPRWLGDYWPRDAVRGAADRRDLEAAE